jgi:hypothetical protein
MQLEPGTKSQYFSAGGCKLTASLADVLMYYLHYLLNSADNRGVS